MSVLRKRFSLWILLVSIGVLWVGALPTSAGAATRVVIYYPPDQVTIENCQIVVSFYMPGIQSEVEVDSKMRFGKLIGESTVEVQLWDDWNTNLVDSVLVTAFVEDYVTVYFPIEQFYDNETVDITIVHPDSDAIIFNAQFGFNVPDSVVAACDPACPYPLRSAIQGAIIQGIYGYWDNDLSRQSDVFVAAGTTWWIIDVEPGWYRIWITCQAMPLWIPAENMTPNYSVVWGGAQLPDPNQSELNVFPQ